MKIVKKILNKLSAAPTNIYNFCVLRYRHVMVGKKLKINGKIFVVSSYHDGIVIGDNVRINSCRKSNPIGGDTKTTLFAKGEGKIRIGNNCGISNATLFACNSISIGNDVMIGGSVKIYDTDFHWLNFQDRVSKNGGQTKPVVIKDGAFIGAHAIVLKGVTIGKHSVVGAGSVVTKNIPDGEIWAGNPAKYIRKIEHS